MRLTAVNARGQQRAIELIEPPLGKGGEGSVYKVKGFAKAVAKVYHDKGDTFREKKVLAMVGRPVQSTAYAWPRVALYDHGAFAGYVMPILETDKYQPWFSLANKSDRMKVCPQFSFLYALSACENLLVALGELHAVGFYVGDLNESGTYVSQNAQVSLIDNDSFAATSLDGENLRCLVGKPEFTAPSIQGKQFADVDRTEGTDLFAAMVLMFQMLTGGSHPSDGVYLGDESPQIAKRIQNGAFAALEKTPGYKSNVRTVVAQSLPKRMIAMFRHLAHEDGKMGVHQCVNVIRDTKENLTQCDKEPRHYWDKRDRDECPWCPLKFDPWSDKKLAVSRPQLQQSSLPALGFNDSDSGPQISRVSSRQLKTPATPAFSPPATSTMATGMSAGAFSSTVYTTPPSASASVPPPATTTTTQPTFRSHRPRGKTKLTYQDGTTRVRPSLGILFRQNPKLAYSCLVDELPFFMRFSWGDATERGTIRAWTIPVGFIAAVLMLLQVDKLMGAYFIPWVGEMLAQYSAHDLAINILRHIVPGIATAVSALVFLSVAISGVVNSAKASKNFYGTLRPHRKSDYQHPIATIAHFSLIPVFYGHIFVIFSGIIIFTSFLYAILQSWIRGSR